MKKYDIVLADPPWMERGAGKIKRGADKHYPLMKTKDIINLPVRTIVNDNAHLYLWTTNSHLKDAFDVIESWGFTYKTCITWVKDRFGLGQYFRGMTEHVLFAVRGNIPYKFDDNGKRMQGTTVINAKRTTHSTKPLEIYDIISKVSDRPSFNKIELFARHKMPGWDIWGNELNNDIEFYQNEFFL